VKKVRTGWRKPVYIEGVVIKDGIKNLVPVLEVEKVTTSKTLWDIVRGKGYEVFVLGPKVNAFPDEVGNIPVVRFAQKTGLLQKQEKQGDPKDQSSGDLKTPNVVRTKHFEEWMANTG